MQILDKIKKLVDSLPEDDRELAYNFIAIRDFDSLKELVDSALIIQKKKLKEEQKMYGTSSLDLSDLRKLKSEVDLYVVQLNGEEDYYEGEEY